MTLIEAARTQRSTTMKRHRAGVTNTINGIDLCVCGRPVTRKAIKRYYGPGKVYSRWDYQPIHAR